MSLVEVQRAVCQEYGAEYLATSEQLKVGLSSSVVEGQRPLHGVRHMPEGDTSGWYIWAGDYSTAEDFFQPVHVAHLEKWQPILNRYLCLAAGWRFLLVPEEGYTDVWFDPSVLG
jgi:hypothetical protein